MKVLNIDQNTDEWLEARKGKITGSKLSSIIVKRGTKKKIGFYQLIADRVALDPDGTEPMDWGNINEANAIEAFEKKHNLKVKRNGLWISDFSDNVAVSPDGVIDDETAIEVKCLSSANHLKIVIENEVPDAYADQVVQYFVVNDDLMKLWFVSYDPRIASKPYHEILVTREEVMGAIDNLKEYQLTVLKEVDEWVEKLAF